MGNYITWRDYPDKNERVFTHVGCEDGNGQSCVPLDNCPPTEADRECKRCHQVVPMISKGALSQRDDAPEPPNNPILVSNMDVNKLVERAYMLGWKDYEKAIKGLSSNASVVEENARQALGKLLQ